MIVCLTSSAGDGLAAAAGAHGCRSAFARCVCESEREREIMLNLVCAQSGFSVRSLLLALANNDDEVSGHVGVRG
jgi:hypothetical protein